MKKSDTGNAADTGTKRPCSGGKDAHPLAQMFPPMSDDEFAAIAADVKANGLVEPIILFEGKILDGMHRLKACLQAQVEPVYVEWAGEGGTPLQFV